LGELVELRWPRYSGNRWRVTFEGCRIEPGTSEAIALSDEIRKMCREELPRRADGVVLTPPIGERYVRYVGSTGLWLLYSFDERYLRLYSIHRAVRK
jgi:hypothetical protein